MLYRTLGTSSDLLLFRSSHLPFKILLLITKYGGRYLNDRTFISTP